MQAVGIDIIEVGRIEAALKRWGTRFLSRVYTPAERDFSLKRHRPALTLAARFCGKEAVSKALGTGFRRGVAPRQIEIRDDEHSRPRVILRGRAREVAGDRTVLLSLSHLRDIAVAVAVLTDSI
jgi:holo-[acyl-carrier protein] synthase